MRRLQMTFDIIEITDEELGKLSAVQMQLLRNAQKKKNELQFKKERDVELFNKLVFTNGMQNSSLAEQKRVELEAQFEYDVGIVREQLQYALKINEPYPNEDEDSEKVGYIVDYSLPYVDRYAIVRDYYLSIEDPAERMNLYTADDVARRYLGSYYTTLYNVLYTYSK